MALLLTVVGAPDGLVGQEWTRVPAEGQRPRYSLLAPDGAARGLVLLLGVPEEAGLPQVLRARGIATVETSVDQETLYLRAPALEALEAVLADGLRRARAPAGRIVVGGMSLGGTGAVSYTEHCAARRCTGATTPIAVFAVDAPLDMERWWRSSAAILRRGWPGSNLREVQWILDRLAAVLGGGPEDQRLVYVARSPYLYFEPRGGNAHYLLETPIRLYTEPDIGFWMEQSRFDFFNLNAFDAAGLINVLRELGHEDAEFVATSGKGRRPDGLRNPHSWSIVDEPDLADWIVRRLNRPLPERRR